MPSRPFHSLLHSLNTSILCQSSIFIYFWLCCSLYDFPRCFHWPCHPMFYESCKCDLKTPFALQIIFSWFVARAACLITLLRKAEGCSLFARIHAAQVDLRSRTKGPCADSCAHVPDNHPVDHWRGGHRSETYESAGKQENSQLCTANAVTYRQGRSKLSAQR